MKTLAQFDRRCRMAYWAVLLALLCDSARAQDRPVILSCPDQTVVAGQTAVFTVVATGAPPLRYQWGRGRDVLSGATVAIAGATNATLTLSNATFANAAEDYWIGVTNGYGGDRWYAIRLRVLPSGPIPGFVDETFHPLPLGYVNDVIVQRDGRLLVGGSGIRRLWPDGSLDTNFVVRSGGDVSRLALQTDGKIMVLTNRYGGYRYLSRLNTDGTIDASFAPSFPWDYPGFYFLGVRISAFALQPDDKVVMAYQIRYARHDDEHWTSPFVRRLNPDGTFDDSFTQSIFGCDDVSGLAVMPDGRILVGTHNLDCLRPDGQADPNFVSSRLEPPRDACDSQGLVYCFAFQADGRFLIGGSFTNVNGQARSHLARLHPNGELDLSFNPPVIGAKPIFGFSRAVQVRALALQADGKVLVGGDFETMDGLPYGGLARLNPDGSLDTNFITGARLLGEDDEPVSGIVVQSSDKAVVAGWFEEYWGKPVHGLARVLLAEAPVAPILTPQPASPFLSNGCFQFAFANSGGHTFTVLATTNLSLPASNWTVLGSSTNLGGGISQFTDPGAADQPRRFYRLRWP